MYAQELRDQACRLYLPGVRGVGTVAKMIGVPKTTVRRWVNPETAEKQRKISREAKRKRKGICSECGGQTSYNGHDKAVSDTCANCVRDQQRANRRWTRENVIAAIQLFHARNGRPPSAKDWNRPDRGTDYPSLGAVIRRSYGWRNAPFGSWSEAIRAAGYEPNQTGRRPNAPRTPQGRYAKEAA